MADDKGHVAHHNEELAFTKTRCVWPPAVTSSKYARRVVMVMRSEERVDRVFGENWMKTELPTGKVHATDLNIPVSQLKNRSSFEPLKNNTPITVLGKYKSILVARALLNRQLSPDLIVCSPSLRCVETAVAIASYLKIEIVIEPGLCENGTAKHHKTIGEYIDGLPINKEYVPVLDFDKLGEESEEKTNKRIREVLCSLIAKPRERPLFIVAHANAQAILATLGNGIPLNEEPPSGGVMDPIELGLRFPPGSIVAIARCTEDPPHAYSLVPNMIPPLTYGKHFCNAPVPM